MFLINMKCNLIKKLLINSKNEVEITRVILEGLQKAHEETTNCVV